MVKFDYGHDMYKTVCIDIDGVVVDWKKCKDEWGCDYSNYPENLETLKRDKCPIMEKAKETIQWMKSIGLRVILHTSRVEEEREKTEKRLKDAGIPYDELAMNKPRAFLYVDDFGYRFDNWDNLKATIQNWMEAQKQ